jgi:phage-related holin
VKHKVADWGLQLLALFLAFVGPIHHYLIGVGVLVIGDFVVGAWASVKKGQKLTSRRMRETVSKMLAYQLAIIIGFVLDGLIGIPDAMVARVISGFIGLTEAKSIFENLATITGLDFWAVIMEKLKPALNADKEVQELEKPADQPKQ